MNKVIHRNDTYYGHTSTIILADGYAYVMVSTLKDSPEVAIIHDLVVHDDRRGEGLGRELLEEAWNEALYLGAKTARLSVQPGSWLEEWYGRHGFNYVGKKEVVADVSHDVLEKSVYDLED